MKFSPLILALSLMAPVFAGTRITELTDAITDAGIPIDGVSSGPSDKPYDCSIQFRDSATKAQRKAAKAIADAWDWKPRSKPCPNKFLQQCMKDEAVSPEDAKYLPLVVQYASDKKLRVLTWSKISKAISDDSRKIIEAYAVENNMPLTP